MDADSLRRSTARRALASRLIPAALVLGVVATLACALLGSRVEPAPVDALAPPAPGPRSARPEPSHAGFSEPAVKRRRFVYARAVGDAAFTRLGPPASGDWLDHFREGGQTVGEHARDCANRRTARRHTLHLQPYRDLDPTQRAVLPLLERFVEAYFTVEAERRPDRSAPPAAWSAGRGQWDAEIIAEDQKRAVPTDSLGVLGLLGGDLYAAGLNFVFGIGLFADRVGVHSLHRFGAEPSALRRRAFALAAHELGHMFGMHHCVFYACVMNGSNSLAETDRQPLHLCPVCREKLRHAIGFTHAERYRGLARFYAEAGMPAEAAFVEGQIEVLGSAR